MAIGRSPDIAINHDIDAIRMHEVNHPDCEHYCESVWDVVPAMRLMVVRLDWYGFLLIVSILVRQKEMCRLVKKSEGLAWIALRWVGQVRPRVLMLENVEEFTTWGPLVVDANGDLRPDPNKKG